MNENFLFKKDLKDIRRSLFERGFSIPVEKQAALSLYLNGGRLRHGEKRTVKIILGNEVFEVTLRSVGFNRGKYQTHSEMWQFNWSKNDPISEKVKNIFIKSYVDLAEDKEYFVLYSMADKDRFHIEPIFNREILIPKISELVLENILELPYLTGEAATLIAKSNLMKIRKMTLSLGAELKRNYNYCCQICGQKVGEFYGADLAECHHINYFSESLNNDADNLLIVCPNHHRIIHAANPTFDRARKLYLYPNGYEEILKLKEHL